MSSPAPAPESLTRIVLRPLGTPLPLGFFAFGMGMFLFGAYDFGWIPKSDTTAFAVITLGFVAPLELIPAILAFFSRDTAGGTILGVFSMSWVATGTAYLVTPARGPHPAIGFFWFGAAGIVLLLAIAALAGKPFFAGILTLSCARFIVGGIQSFTTSEGLAHASGILGFVLTGVAFYGSMALLLEDLKGRTVLPLGRRKNARRAVEGGLADQLERIAREAGVRQQL